MAEPSPGQVSAFPDGISDIEEVVVGDERFELPQRYYDWSFVMAHFPASTRRVRRLLPPGDALRPVEIVPGLAVVSLAAFEYRRARSLAPYNEVGVMVPVRHSPERSHPLLPLLYPERYGVGFWVHYLPVTTPQADAAGREIWGFPKVVADIRFQDVGWTRRCRLRANGQDVLTLDAAMGETRTEPREFHAFSIKDGTLLRTLVDTRAQYHGWFLRGGGASFTLGDHPVAQQLRDARIRNVAVGGLFAFSARSRLHRGRPAAGGPGGV